MKCAGCGKEIKGESYCTYHYDGVRDESGNDLMIEDHGPELYFGDCCVVRIQWNGCGFRDLVLKDHMWPYSRNRWGEPLKFLSEKGKELAKRGIDLLVEKKEYIITAPKRN